MSFTNNHFNDVFGKVISLLETTILSGEYKASKQICQEIIDKWRLILINQELKEKDLNYMLYSLILLKSVEDFSDLGILTSNKNWITDNAQIENIWIKMWNCSDRTAFSLRIFELKLIGYMFNELKRLENHFKAQFGNGLYTSPGIIKDDLICTICDNDIRTCSHIQGHVYSGKICRIKSEKIKLIEISIVEYPKDPRCRIWPWNMDENKKFSGCAYYFFSVDDFIYKEFNTEPNNVYT